MGDRVVTHPDATPEDNTIARVQPGVVVDVSSIDLLTAEPLLVVDFPWAERYVVARPADLERVAHDEDEAGYAPPALVDSARRIMKRVTELNNGRVPAGVLPCRAPDDDAFPPGVGYHAHQGRDDRPCDWPGCGKPESNPVHVLYRLAYLEDLGDGDPVFVAGGPDGHWVRGWVSPGTFREFDGNVAVIIQIPGAQRSIVGPRFATTPVPVE